jgi:hypothetical protein
MSGGEGTPAGPHPAHGQVVYLQLPAADVTASAAFYEAVFGWSVDPEKGRFEAPGVIGANSCTPSRPPMPSSAAATCMSACVSTPPVTGVRHRRWSPSSLSSLRDGTHPLAAELGTLASCPGQAAPGRHRRQVPKEPGRGRQVEDNQRRQANRRSGRTQATDPTPAPRQPSGSRAGSTIHSLPADSGCLLI